MRRCIDWKPLLIYRSHQWCKCVSCNVAACKSQTTVYEYIIHAEDTALLLYSSSLNQHFFLFLCTFLQLCITAFTWCRINKILLIHSTNDSRCFYTLYFHLFLFIWAIYSCWVKPKVMICPHCGMYFSSVFWWPGSRWLCWLTEDRWMERARLELIC